MADVMLGRSDGIEGFERHVVLKRIRPELARDQRFIRMFLDEARVVATLHHQHIVQVYDIGEANGEYFLAMEYVHGEDVRKILSNAARQRTHVPLGYAIAIVSAAAAGLHYAHERRGVDKQPLSIVHRDVSPSNILVGYDGAVKVVDFGVASASMRQETRSGSLKGKLSYMAPEQCRGMQVDRRADVYALGVVLYELATTTRMIKGENDYLVMEQIVHGKIAPPQTRRPGLPAELSEIIMRALASDREQRYESADELRIALDQFATSSALTASTSAIAAYMRQQFGQRPEPWLEIDGRVTGPSEDVPTAPTTALDESPPSGSWVDSPRSSVNRRASTSSIPRQSGPIGLIADGGAEPGVRSMPQHALQTQPTLGGRTDSRMGWEHVPRAPAPRSIPIQKLAIGGGSALVAGLVLWLLAGRGGAPAPAPVTAATALPATAPAAAPQVTPLPPAPPPAAAVAMAPPPDAGVAPATAPRAIASREPDPQAPRKARSVSVATPTRTPPRPASEPPASARPERNPRIAVAGPPEPAAQPAAETEVHHPAPPPMPPPAPPPSAPAPAVTAAIPPPTPAAPAGPSAPAVIAAVALEANRTSGDRNIVPDSATMDAITRSGTDKVASSYKICVGTDGNISTVSLLKTSGFPAYDDKIQATIRRDWRYRPFQIDGKPTAVCTAIRFVYAQR
jgi:serine/threonine protein kinase/outer membrane biosynthesis protein TonB